MNYTEMEAKVGTHPHLYPVYGLGICASSVANCRFLFCWQVREATNNEPWGASSTLMQEIANGTHS